MATPSSSGGWEIQPFLEVCINPWMKTGVLLLRKKGYWGTTSILNLGTIRMTWLYLLYGAEDHSVASLEPLQSVFAVLSNKVISPFEMYIPYVNTFLKKLVEDNKDQWNFHISSTLSFWNQFSGTTNSISELFSKHKMKCWALCV